MKARDIYVSLLEELARITSYAIIVMEIKVIIFFVLATHAFLGAKSVSRQTADSLNFKKESKLRIKTVWRPRSEVYENVFNLYDPTFLAVVWPKITNGVHLVVSNKCWKDITLLFKDLSKGEAWAYSVIDATGRYPSALFTGNHYWLGSKEQCLQLDSRVQNSTNNEITLDDFINGGFKDVLERREKNFDDADDNKNMAQHLTDEVVPPYHVAYFAAQFKLNINKYPLAQTHDITLGVCFPESCSLTDVQALLNLSNMLTDKLKSNTKLTRNIKLTSLRKIVSYDVTSDIGALLIIAFTLILVVLAIIATLLDLNLLRWRPYPKKMSFDVPKISKEPNRIAPGTPNSSIEGIKESNLGKEISTVPKPNVDQINVKKMTMPAVMPPSITLEVQSTERSNCQRCGKYKKQCNDIRRLNKLPVCSRTKSFISLSTEEKTERPYWQTILICFSLKYSLKKLFNKNTTNKNLLIIHWLRIVATMWMILVHVAIITSNISDDSGNVSDKNNVYLILATGNLAFDTLFFTSGLFSSHHFFYLKSLYSVDELVSFGGFFGQILQFVCFVTNRAIRLLPPYIYMGFLSGILSRVSRETSAITLPERDYYNCHVYWWRNLLYINNFYPKAESCMQVSWYLSTETQLHAFAMLLLTVCGGARIHLAVFLAAAGLLAATAADVIVTYNDFNAVFPTFFAAYSTMINRPWARIAPYFIGVFAGWLVHKMDGKMNGSKVVASCLWLVSAVTIIISPVLLWLAPAWISAWLHLTWPIALLWPALVCSTKYSYAFRKLDSSCAAAASRLCYGALLVHGAAARALLLAPHTAVCAHTSCIWFYFTGVAVFSVVAALPLTLLLEMPCCSLLRKISTCARS